MTQEPLPAGAADAPAPAASAGALLAQARQDAGLSVDDIATQLKLAPRQVNAIERDDFASLPGRTFVRGFVRNYARLLKLDVDAVLAALPGDGSAPTPERPVAPSAARSIGEMPRDARPRPGAARWAIPLVLVAIVGVAAFYEFARPPLPAQPVAQGADPSAPTQPAAAPVQAPAAAQSGPPAASPAAGGAPPSATELPNPLSTAAPAPDAVSAPIRDTPVVPGAAATSPAGRSQLALAFRGTSWIEVRDRTGNVVLSITGTSGATREIPVAPPGEVIIGNAAVVDASWRGRQVDLAPYTKQNVARIKLE